MAYTIEELKAQLSKITSLTKALAGSKKEFAELPNLLDSTEAVQSITPARRTVTAGASVASSGALMGSGLLVATDKRLLFVNKKMFSTDTTDYYISKINSISFEKKLLLSNILITFSGEKMAFSVEDKEAGQHFVDTVRHLIKTRTDRLDN